MFNWSEIRRLMKRPSMWAVALLVTATLVTCSAMGAPPRTLPHDHSTQGKGGTTVNPSVLGSTISSSFYLSGDTNIFYDQGCTKGTNCGITTYFNGNTTGEILGGLTMSEAGSPQVSFFSQMHGADFYISGEDSGGTIRSLINCDPDTFCIFYANGDETLRTQGGGIRVTDDVGDHPEIVFFQDDGATANGSLIFNDINGPEIESNIHGLPITLQAETAGGTDTDMLILDPDGGLAGSMFPCNIALTSANSKTSDATIATDPDLDCTNTLVTAGYYKVEVMLKIDEGGGGFDWRFGGTSNFDYKWTYFNGSNGATSQCDTTTIDCYMGSAGVSSLISFTSAEVGTTGGYISISGVTWGGTSLYLQWAQETSNAGASLIEQGSYISIQRIQ